MKDLTSYQAARLAEATAALRIDKITVSYSLEGRDHCDRKKSVFYCASASKDPGTVTTDVDGLVQGGMYTLAEARLARCILAKHVVSCVYDEAMRRGILSPDEAKTEVAQALASYDMQIARLLPEESHES